MPFSLLQKFFLVCSEQEKARRWQEIRIRQHRLMSDVETLQPANIEHIMKSGFTMNDIKALNRNYSEDAAEADEQLNRSGYNGPARPPRKGSLSRATAAYDPPTLQLNGTGLQRSSSALDMGRYQSEQSRVVVVGGGEIDRKKRGRSPFRLFGKKRDQSKEKVKAAHDELEKRHPMSKCTIDQTNWLYNSV